MNIPIRYLPKNLSKKDKMIQLNALLKSIKFYKKHRYYTRPKLKSFKNKPSKHIQNAINIYGVNNITPTQKLADVTGCSLKGLNSIVKKGEGAYYSSGSRPNQTARSWGLARLASSITSGKSASIDWNILQKECNHQKKAYKLAKQSRDRMDGKFSRNKIK
jgi:hypothetical protein